MGRDLLYKPPVPLVVPDEPADSKKVVPTPGTDKLGLKTRGRDLGGTQDTEPGAKARAADSASGQPAGADAKAADPAPAERGPAFKAAYFNRDVAATTQVNQRSRPAQALRGAEGVSDLKKVVLPESDASTPDPAQLRAAGDLMGLDAGAPLDLGSMLARQGSWLRAKSVTAELIEARMAQMQQMIAVRIAALARMSRLPKDRLQRSTTLSRAASSQGAALEDVDDVAEAGETLLRSTSEQAQGLHRRLAKALGIKSTGDK